MTAALLGTAGLSWVAAQDSPDVVQAQAAGSGAVAAVPDKAVCTVRYQVRSDSGTDYEAQLTVATTGDAATGQWRVQFSYPGSQRLTDPPKAVTQQGRKIVAKGRGRLKTFTLHGGYRGYNPLPLSFTLDGHRCRAEVLGGVTAVGSDGEPVSEPTGQQRRATRGEGDDARRDRPPRKSSTPQKRVHQQKPAPAGPPMAPTFGLPGTGGGSLLAL